MTLDTETWRLIALILGGIFILLALGGIGVLFVASKKKVDASPALPSVKPKSETEVAVEAPFAATEFTTTKAAPEPKAGGLPPLSRRTLRSEGSETEVAPRTTAARSFFADDEDDDFDFTLGRD